MSSSSESVVLLFYAWLGPAAGPGSTRPSHLHPSWRDAPLLLSRAHARLSRRPRPVRRLDLPPFAVRARAGFLSLRLPNGSFPSHPPPPTGTVFLPPAALPLPPLLMPTQQHRPELARDPPVPQRPGYRRSEPECPSRSLIRRHRRRGNRRYRRERRHGRHRCSAFLPSQVGSCLAQRASAMALTATTTMMRRRRASPVTPARRAAASAPAAPLPPVAAVQARAPARGFLSRRDNRGHSPPTLTTAPCWELRAAVTARVTVAVAAAAGARRRSLPVGPGPRRRVLRIGRLLPLRRRPLAVEAGGRRRGRPVTAHLALHSRTPLPLRLTARRPLQWHRLPFGKLCLCLLRPRSPASHGSRRTCWLSATQRKGPPCFFVRRTPHIMPPGLMVP